jgi:uroporphyrinogen-III synthase
VKHGGDSILTVNSSNVEAVRRPLAGYTVGITGHRRWEEQAQMLSRRGARVLHGPTMTTELLGDVDATLAATEQVLARPVDLVILTTGIGVRSWFGAAESIGMEEALRHAFDGVEVVARGPKAQSAARHVGLEVTWTAPTETNDEILARLGADGIAGKRVVVQRDGGEPLFADTLVGLGPAEVVDIPVYRWHMPEDVTPAARLLDAAADRQVDAVTFTSSYAVHNAFEIATDQERLATAFDDDVLAVAVGPVTGDSLRQFGVRRVVEPERARLGSMIRALSDRLEQRARVLDHDGVSRRWQGTVLIDDAGHETELTRGEARLLAVLVDRAPTVVPKASLVEQGADDHAAEAAVARLRAKLGPLGGGIRTVRRRGYACTLAVRRLSDSGEGSDAPDGSR